VSGGAALEQTWRRRNCVRILPSAHEISAMERALEWPGRHLRRHVELARSRNICALAKARELAVEDVVRRGKAQPGWGIEASPTWPDRHLNLHAR
jgi:hypothetical protein